jgi:hypothetical protein
LAREPEHTANAFANSQEPFDRRMTEQADITGLTSGAAFRGVRGDRRH